MNLLDLVVFIGCTINLFVFCVASSCNKEDTYLKDLDSTVGKCPFFHELEVLQREDIPVEAEC